jgi:hypothetical protein
MILLRANDGLTDEEIAEDLGIGRATAERVRKRCVERFSGAVRLIRSAAPR